MAIVKRKNGLRSGTLKSLSEIDKLTHATIKHVTIEFKDKLIKVPYLEFNTKFENINTSVYPEEFFKDIKEVNFVPDPKLTLVKTISNLRKGDLVKLTHKQTGTVYFGPIYSIGNTMINLAEYSSYFNSHYVEKV